MAISTAVAPSAVARILGIETKFVNLRGGVFLLPQRIAVVGQGNTASTYATTKAQVTSALDVANTYGFGSPLHLAVKQLLPANGDGVGVIPVTVYPLVDDGSGVASAGDITPVGTATADGAFIVKINNIPSAEFVIADGDLPAVAATTMVGAINAALDVPMIAVDGTGSVDLTSKWEGTSANDLFIEVVGPTDIGVTFTITQPVGGLVNPDVDDALNQVGDVWETLVLNCMDIADTTTLDKYATFGEGRWGALVRKPLVVFTGNPALTPQNAIVIPEARKTDRTNCQLVSPGSNDLPFVNAARQLASIAVVANNDPARDYGSQTATGLVPGTDGEQWNAIERELAVQGGSSTIKSVDSVVTISDVITFYHPTGDENPAYRFVKDVIALQNVLFSLDLEFNTPEWDGAPLIPDDQPTSSRSAKKPRMAVAAVASIIDALAVEAILANPETAKASIVAGINGSNQNRLDIAFTIQLAGNANIISIDNNFGFFFGTAPIVA